MKIFRKQFILSYIYIKCSCFDFLNGYNSINDRDWENDDDLLLVYMILCLSIERLSPQDFVELNLLPDGSLNVCTKYRKFLTRQVLYKSFERLKENLVDESMITIKLIFYVQNGYSYNKTMKSVGK